MEQISISMFWSFQVAIVSTDFRSIHTRKMFCNTLYHNFSLDSRSVSEARITWQSE